MSLGIKRTRPMRVAIKEFVGKQADITNEFESLYAWARRLGLRIAERETSGRSSLPWIANLQNQEETTPDDERSVELWLPMDGAGPSTPEYVVKDITHETVAFMIHRGAMSRLDESVDQLFEWAKEKELGHSARYHRRIYLRGVDAYPEDPDWEAEIQIPLMTVRSN